MAACFGVLALLVLLTALGLFWLARRQRAQTGLPFRARIVYADTGAWHQVEGPLFSRRYGLVGKPDYIVEDKGATIPVEVKPNRAAAAPRASDVMQLAAYGLLIEEARATGAPTPYGLLKYRDAVFQVDLADDLRRALLDLLDAMRRDLAARDVPRSHAEARRCQRCGYRAECGQAME